MSWCGGGRNQAHARHAVAQLADVVAHLAAGQLAALAGLGALRHLDLDLVGAVEVFGGDTEAARRHLLDLRAHGVAGLQRVVDLKHILAQQVGHGLALLDRDALELVAVAQRVFAAFAGVALAADAVHGHGQRGVRLGGNGTQRHGAGGEALDDLLGRLHLVDGMALLGSILNSNRPRSVMWRLLWSLMIWAYSL
jgi:hypothetical protein